MQKFNCWKGEWALGYVLSLIWDYSNTFLIVLKRSAAREVIRISRYQISGLILVVANRTVLKHCKVPKYYIKGYSYCKPFEQSYCRILIILKFSKIKIKRQNRSSFHKVCLHIVIIHYILFNFNYIYCSNFNCIMIILYSCKR